MRKSRVSERLPRKHKSEPNATVKTRHSSALRTEQIGPSFEPGHKGTSMKLYLVFGFICLVAAVLLSCIAGAYAATSTLAAVAFAFTACLALFIGVRCVADRR